MSDETVMAKRVKEKSTTLSVLLNELGDIVAVYQAKGFDSGAGNPISDEDVASEGVTAFQIAMFITMCIQIDKLLNNQSAVQGFYQNNLELLRNDFKP